MKSIHRITGLWWGLVFMLLVACEGGFTPADLEQRVYSVTMPALSSQPTSLTIDELNANKESYIGQKVRVSGRYQPPPKIICDSVFRQSPANWELKGATSQIKAGGINEQLDRLVPADLLLTVEGTWQYWRGSVGCGKDSDLVDFYYLAVTQVLSPNPITAITLTPNSSALTEESPSEVETVPANGEAVILPTSTIIPTQTETSPTVSPLPSPTAQIALSSTPQLLPTNTLIPTALPPETATRIVETATMPASTPTLIPSETPTISATTTFTATVEITNTATPENAGTPSPTPDVTNKKVQKGLLDGQDLVAETLALAEIHVWQYVVTTTDVLTVNVASAINMDIVISLSDPNGQIITLKNDAPAGEPETLLGVNLGNPGTYEILVFEVNGNHGDYSLILQGLGDYTFLLRGTMSYGQNRNDFLKPDNDHFWYFEGGTNDVINIKITPTDGLDLFLEIYNPDGSKIGTTINDEFAGGIEEIIGLELLTDGFYAIRVGEQQFSGASYTIELTLED